MTNFDDMWEWEPDDMEDCGCRPEDWEDWDQEDWESLLLGREDTSYDIDILDAEWDPMWKLYSDHGRSNPSGTVLGNADGESKREVCGERPDSLTAQQTANTGVVADATQPNSDPEQAKPENSCGKQSECGTTNPQSEESNND